MAQTTYENIVEYLLACTNANDEYKAYCDLQKALRAQMIANAAGQELDSYELDDGQSKIKTTIKDFSKIVSTIDAIEVLKERIVNNNIGQVSVNRDVNAIISLCL